jgi:anti-sigma regulatory factor (Ser/Thr protein kinase)
MDTLFDLPTSAAADIRAFAGTPESVGAARAWVAGFLPDSPAADDAALMTSELVTNAIQYSASRLPGGIVTVSVSTDNGSARVDVIDQGEIPPSLAAPHGLGQGLEIVRQLADVFGADGPDRWFSLRLGGAR